MDCKVTVCTHWSGEEKIVAEIEGYQEEIGKKNNEISELEQKIKDKIAEVRGE